MHMCKKYFFGHCTHITLYVPVLYYFFFFFLVEILYNIIYIIYSFILNFLFFFWCIIIDINIAYTIVYRFFLFFIIIIIIIIIFFFFFFIFFCDKLVNFFRSLPYPCSKLSHTLYYFHILFPYFKLNGHILFVLQLHG